MLIWLQIPVHVDTFASIWMLHSWIYVYVIFFMILWLYGWFSLVFAVYGGEILHVKMNMLRSNLLWLVMLRKILLVVLVDIASAFLPFCWRACSTRWWLVTVGPICWRARAAHGGARGKEVPRTHVRRFSSLFGNLNLFYSQNRVCSRML